MLRKNRAVDQGKLVTGSVGEFLAALGGDSAAPGGGSAAAVAVAMATALTQSVARISADRWPEADAVLAQADTVQRRLLPLVGRDAEAYEEALRTLRDRESIPERDRDDRLQDALDTAAEVPFRICDAAADSTELAGLAVAAADPALRADALAAAILAEAAARITLRLVEINLGTLPDDPRVQETSELARQAAKSLEQAFRVESS